MEWRAVELELIQIELEQRNNMNYRTKLYKSIYEEVCDEADAIDWGDATYSDKVAWISQETRRRHEQRYKRPDTPDIKAIQLNNFENRRA